jgi:deoxyribodipyrimidine photo-lyase
MKKTYQKSVFIFRRDLRLEDNLGLLAALEQSEKVVPIFIFDPAQTDQTKNDYFSAPAFTFLLNSLAELNEDLNHRQSQLYIFSGQPDDVVDELIQQDQVDAVFVNKDYTPFARKRDGAIDEVCQKHNVPFFRYDDCALSKLEDIKTGEDKIYTVFTPFMKKASQSEVAEPRKNNFENYFSSALNTPIAKIEDFHIDCNKDLILKGGRTEALEILNNHQYLDNYKDRRNLPADNGTSRLSAHHKFGTISIRESFHLAKEVSGAGNHFISELYWRDFYLYIAYHFPQVFRTSFLPWAKHIEWINDKDQFEAWTKGMTGVPMVDAGMRELNETGWMHNRPRMIVASYLTKNLLIDWRWGEKYFAQNLIDYDPSQNNGGWQWSASTGADPKPLRIFNPYTQAVNYDNQAEYIKKWVPELESVSAQLLTDGKTQDFSEFASDYPAPLVDQKDSFHRAMEVYKKAKDTYKNQL